MITNQKSENQFLPLGLFLLCLVAFIILKIPHISLPFFWDESGVYGKIIFHLSDTGLSLHPKAISEWISRGHPLLYPNMIASVTRVFGESVTVAHTANFVLACVLLVSMYYCLRKPFGQWVGLIAPVILMIQPLFFAQSVFVLPEVALCLFLWWATWAFIQRNFWLYALTGSAAVLIKEPAIVWLAGLICWDLLHVRKAKWWHFGIWLSPLMVFGLFLMIQKNALGWYFFPYHTGGFDFKPASVADKGGDYLEYLFWKEGRYLWLIIIIAAGLITLLKRTGSVESSAPVMKQRFYAGLFVACLYLLFSSTTFYHQRYILPVFIPICCALAILLEYCIVQQRHMLALGFIAVMGFLSFRFYMSADKFNYDLDMSYTRSIESSKKTIKTMLDEGMLEQDEFTATIPLLYATNDERFGYLPAGVTGRYSRAIHAGTKYAVKIFPGTEIENPDQYPLELIREWYDYDIKTTLYKVLPLDTTQLKLKSE